MTRVGEKGDVMFGRRIRVVGIAALLGVPVVAVAGTAHTSAATCVLPAGVVDAVDLPPGSSVAECKAVGRLVRKGGLIAQVPEPGVRVTMEALYEEGAAMMSIEVSPDGVISYPPEGTSIGGVVTTGSPAACDDGAYTDKDEEQADAHDWWLGDGTRPAGLTTNQTRDMLKESVGWVVSAHNDCGLPDNVNASWTYEGVSTLESDVTNSGGNTSCGDGSTDGRDDESVVDFGNLDTITQDGEQFVPLALECTWVLPQPFGDNNILESDIRFNTTDKTWFYTKPNPCTGSKFDLRSVAVHEFGHSFGMGHVDEETHEFLTMSKKVDPCNISARTLGLGDVRSLENTY